MRERARAWRTAPFRGRPRSAFLWCSLLLVAASCGDAISEYRVVRTPSGASWKVVSSQPFVTQDGEKAVRIKYETDLDFADRDALRSEAHTFFADVRTQLASADITVGVVTVASPIQEGWEMERDTLTFRLNRQADGSFAFSRGAQAN